MRPDWMRHELKTWPEPFKAVWLGKKKHETRKNDRDFRVGDELHLREWEPAASKYSGRSIFAKVTYLGTGFGLPDEICVMSIAVLGCSLGGFDD